MNQEEYLIKFVCGVCVCVCVCVVGHHVKRAGVGFTCCLVIWNWPWENLFTEIGK